MARQWAEASRRGLGHELLTKMTAQTLSGEARLTYAKDGLEWTVECPAEAAIDRARSLRWEICWNRYGAR